MDIKEAIQQLAQTRDEKYCKICLVDAVDESARTVDVSPLDESAPILGVNLQANQSGDMGVAFFPKVGSYVVVSFLNPATGVVVLTEEIDKMMLKIGDTTVETVNGKITFNGGENGGLVIIQNLTDKINSLVDAFNNHTHMLSSGSVVVAGSATTQNNAAPITVPAITDKAQKLQKGDYENETITH